MQKFSAIRSILDSVLGGVVTALFAVMTIVGTYQIVVRYFFNRPSTISEELLTYSFSWMALLAAAYVFGKRDHMRMAFLADKISGNGKLALEVIIEILIVLFAGIVMVYGGINITKLTMSQITASLRIPMGYVYTVVPISGLCIMIYSIINISDMLSEERNEVDK